MQVSFEGVARGCCWLLGAFCDWIVHGAIEGGIHGGDVFLQSNDSYVVNLNRDWYGFG